MKKKTGQVSIYGGIKLRKQYCSDCRGRAFVIDGILQCCDKEALQPTTEKLVRECTGDYRRRHIPKGRQQQILLEQENKCKYCELEFGSRIKNLKTDKQVTLKITFDHVIPWSYSGTNKEEIVAACQVCNGLKSNDFFDDIDSIKVELKNRRQNHGWLI
ncbi:MAG: HNH endonuclease signature motif containing protein [Thermodesulfobacteriota bacterium]